MKRTFTVILFFVSVFLFANPKDDLLECISWMGKDGASLKQIGAVQSGEDVDLRPYGLHLLKHYVWVKGYTGFFAQTSDGIIINTKGSLRIGGIKDGRLQSINYKNQNEFDADAEFIRQMVYSYNGTVNRVRESLGIRTILYKLTLNGMNIDITVSIHIDDPQKNGYGWIDMDIKK